MPIETKLKALVERADQPLTVSLLRVAIAVYDLTSRVRRSTLIAGEQTGFVGTLNRQIFVLYGSSEG